MCGMSNENLCLVSRTIRLGCALPLGLAQVLVQHQEFLRLSVRASLHSEDAVSSMSAQSKIHTCKGELNYPCGCWGSRPARPRPTRTTSEGGPSHNAPLSIALDRGT